MNKVFAIAAVVAGLGASSAAQADLFSSINSINAQGTRWFNDFPNSTLTVTNNGLTSVRIQDSNFIGTGFTNRHHTALAVNNTPYLFSGAQAFQLDVDVIITGPGPARTEAGIWVGTAPNYPSSAFADVGNFVLLPDNSGEIAAFGGVLPFFSNNQPANSGMNRAVRNATRHLTFIYNTSPGGSSINYGVDGVFTGNQGFGGLNPNTYIGFYTQGPNGGGPVVAGNIDVTFSNITIAVPGPATASLLGMGGLLAARRRRR